MNNYVEYAPIITSELCSSSGVACSCYEGYKHFMPALGFTDFEWGKMFYEIFEMYAFAYLHTNRISLLHHPYYEKFTFHELAQRKLTRIGTENFKYMKLTRFGEIR